MVGVRNLSFKLVVAVVVDELFLSMGGVMYQILHWNNPINQNNYKPTVTSHLLWHACNLASWSISRSFSKNRIGLVRPGCV